MFFSQNVLPLMFFPRMCCQTYVSQNVLLIIIFFPAWLAAHSGKKYNWQQILGEKHDWLHILGKNIIGSTFWENPWFTAHSGECAPNHVFPQNLLPIIYFFQNVLPIMLLTRMCCQSCFFPRICGQSCLFFPECAAKNMVGSTFWGKHD
jgi:hypothetical protein